MRRRQGHSDNPNLLESINNFRQLSRQPPAIIDFILNGIDPSNPNAGFNKEQLETLLAAVMFRSSSTYASIPYLVADFNSLGMYDRARTINANASDEVGNKKNDSHATLLHNSLEMMAELLGCITFKNPLRYYVTRKIIRIRRTEPSFLASEIKGDLDLYSKMKEYNDAVGSKSPHQLPEITSILFPGGSTYASLAKLRDALYLANLIPDSFLDYHDQVLSITRRTLPGKTYQIDKPELAIRALELAVREASSVDELDTGRLSYIGAYGKLFSAYTGYATSPHLLTTNAATIKKRVSALEEWALSHNDAATGQLSGWKHSAEEGHAEDAANIALRIISELSDEDYNHVLDEASSLSKARLCFWETTVKAVKDLEGVGPKIKPKPFQKPNIYHQIAQWIPGLSL